MPPKRHKAKAFRKPVSAPSSSGVPAGIRRAVKPVLLVVCLVLLITTDDRQVGGIADGRQMIFGAVALTESATLGQARGRDLAIARPEGDSVSRFGMGMTFAQVP